MVPAMSWLRAARRATGPTGQEWEIYITRGAFARWRPADYEAPTESEYALTPLTMILGVIAEIPLLILSQIVWPLIRFVVMLPVVGFQSARTGTRLVEAISYSPQERYGWRAAPDQVTQVVDEIAASLAAGHVPRPGGAAFLGHRDG
jgi:hypothetical protein